jgi:UPF0271 protein
MTTSAVFEEVKHIKKSHAALDALVDAGNLAILDPDKKSVDKIIAVAKKTGDIGKLSDADISILALALEHDATLMSDDYAVANVAASLQVKVASSSGKGIRETRKYIAYCSTCGKAFSPTQKECPNCGSQLKRRYKVTG